MPAEKSNPTITNTIFSAFSRFMVRLRRTGLTYPSSSPFCGCYHLDSPCGSRTGFSCKLSQLEMTWLFSTALGFLAGGTVALYLDAKQHCHLCIRAGRCTNRDGRASPAESERDLS